MLHSALADDQIAKNAATFGYQFGYQLADGTGQKLRDFSPVHSVRDRGVGDAMRARRGLATPAEGEDGPRLLRSSLW